MFRRVLAAVLSTALLVGPVYAQLDLLGSDPAKLTGEKPDAGAKAEAASSGPTCASALSDSSPYDLAQGKDGLFFRGGTDLDELFTVMPETLSSLKTLADVLAVRGTKLVMMPLPTRGIVQYAYLSDSDPRERTFDRQFAYDEFEGFVGQLTGAGIAAVDVLSSIAADESWDDFFYLRDHHWTTQGARKAAIAVANTLRMLPEYTRLPKIAFETNTTGRVMHKVDMALAIQRECGVAFDGEPDNTYTTTRSVASATDLFGNSETTPPSVLVGSSFSATPEFNFDGFLSQESGLEISNHAINGAEFSGSLASYLVSPDFAANPPPFLIWETPSYYNIDQEVFRTFRQIIPAVFGACTPENAIASSPATALNGETKMLSLDSGQKIGGPGYFITVDASQIGTKGLVMTVRYDDGDADELRLGDFPRFEDSGKFYAHLSDEFRGNVIEIGLRGNTGADTVAVSLCKVPDQFASILVKK